MPTFNLNPHRTAPHCEMCGREVDPFSQEDGYTNCCNELICYGTTPAHDRCPR